MRGREFLMKDAYSFDLDADGARQSYNRMFIAYLRTFARMGLKAVPDAGRHRPDRRRPQPRVHHSRRYRRERGVLRPRPDRDAGSGRGTPTTSQNLEPMVRALDRQLRGHRARCTTPQRFEREVPAERRLSARGIEVGHIFYFGTKYSEPMKCQVQGPDGSSSPVQWGSYGVGVSRLVGAIIEASHDERWHHLARRRRAVHVGLINLGPATRLATRRAPSSTRRWAAPGKRGLYDDTDERAGAKFATMDLIGLPWQVIVGPKGLAAGEVELKRRATGERMTIALDAAIKKLHQGLTAIQAPEAAHEEAGPQLARRPRQDQIARQGMNIRRHAAGLAHSRPSSGCSPSATCARAQGGLGVGHRGIRGDRHHARRRHAHHRALGA